MSVERKPSSPSPIAAVRRRVLGTFAPAALGCVLGFYYHQWFGPTGTEAGRAMAGLYATMGAAGMILATRLGAILFALVQDLRGKH